MEERSLLIKKYIFPAIVILLGLILTNTALFSGTGSINQSGTFLLGAIVVLIMGIVTVLYIKEIIGGDIRSLKSGSFSKRGSNK